MATEITETNASTDMDAKVAAAFQRLNERVNVWRKYKDGFVPSDHDGEEADPTINVRAEDIDVLLAVVGDYGE